MTINKQPEYSSFIVKNTLPYSDKVYPTVSMEIDSQASLTDMLDAFSNFLGALGYILPPNSYLDFIEEDDSEPLFHQNGNGSQLLNE